MKRFLALLFVLFAVLAISNEASAQKVYTLPARKLLIDDSCNIGPITTIGGVNNGQITNTDGPYGVPAVLDTVEKTQQIATVGAANFLSSTASGAYIAYYSISTTATDAGAPTMSTTIAWNDGAAKSFTSSTVSGASTANQANGVLYLTNTGATAITYATTESGTIGTAKFKLSWVLIRIY